MLLLDIASSVTTAAASLLAVVLFRGASPAVVRGASGASPAVVRGGSGASPAVVRGDSGASPAVERGNNGVTAAVGGVASLHMSL